MNLLQAVNQNNVDGVKKLLANSRTNINVLDNHNFSALHHAVAKKNLEICKLLVSHKKFNCLIRSHEGCTALMIAIVSNVDLEIIKLLVEAKPVFVTMKNNEEVPPIHEAVKNRRLDIVKVLLENGANVNDFDLELENSLHLAASNSDYNMIEFLLNETEVDQTAKNRDEMNPLCLLLVRSRNEDEDLVAACFHLMLENTYEKNPATNTYAIKDIFQCSFLACVYSHTEIVKFLIHNIYSVNNSRYAFIQKLSEYCDGDNTEFLYYILVFLHDEIDAFDKFKFPRFSEINYYMCIRSVIYIMEMLLPADDAVAMIITILQHMNAIGFNIRVKEFEDQIGVLLFSKYSSAMILERDEDKIDKIFRHLLLNNFRLNLMVKSFLHSIAIAKESDAINVESAMKVLRILLHYATTFFVDTESWKQIKDFKKLNPQIQRIVKWLAMDFGNFHLNNYLKINPLFSMKHLCRNRIREQLNYDANVLCNHDNLMNLGLPEVLVNYIGLKE